MTDSRNSLETITLTQRQICLDHARELLNAAKRVVGEDEKSPNIAYHLVLLALEEIGKSQLIMSRAVVRERRNSDWMDKRLNDHVFKMQWAIWSPMMLSSPIDPKQFEQARNFAQRLHAKRLSGLYVDHVETQERSRPMDAIDVEDFESVFSMVETALAIEEEKKPDGIQTDDNQLVWFLEATTDEQKQRRLFSKAFINKLEKLQDPREWIKWAKEEIEKIERKEDEFLKKELARDKPPLEEAKPRWVLNIKFFSRWHVARQKVLDTWNSQVDIAQFYTTKNSKNGELLLKLTLYDNVKVDEIFDQGIGLCKLFLAMLNIGSGGYFWHNISPLSDTYFESIEDLDDPSGKLDIKKPSGISSLHMHLPDENNPQRKDRLEETHLSDAFKCLLVHSRLSKDDAEPIFGPYFFGLTLLSKSDFNFSCDDMARDEFLKSLKAALIYFEDWDGEEASLIDALHVVLSDIVPEQSHRDTLFASLSKNHVTDEKPIVIAFHMKRLADLYLSFVADRRLRQSMNQLS